MAELRPEEIDKIFKKPPDKRFSYFIRMVADTEAVYGLADEEGWAIIGDDDDDEDIIPLFPAEVFAERFRVENEFEEYGVGALDVNELLEWLDEMEEQGIKIAVFPNLQISGLVITAAGLKEELMAELDKYDEDGKKIR